MKKNTGFDIILTGFTMIIGLAAVAHLALAVLGWSFSRCAYFYVFGTAVLLCVLVLGCIFEKRRRVPGGPQTGAQSGTDGHFAKYLLKGLFVLVVLSQMLYIVMAQGAYREGDMTVEIVNSFLAEDGVYVVNPMTGQPYTAGIPMRLKILCLPSLYGFWSIVTNVSVTFLVHKAAAVVVLLLAYTAYGALGKVLFSEDGRRRAGFLLTVALLVWVSAYSVSMDGFGLLCCGWSAVTIRNTVLMPWLLSLILRRKWLCAVLCILAEGCIAWTLYGAGVGVFVVAGMLIAELVSGALDKGQGHEQAGKEEAR